MSYQITVEISPESRKMLLNIPSYTNNNCLDAFYDHTKLLQIHYTGDSIYLMSQIDSSPLPRPYQVSSEEIPIYNL